MLGGLDTPSEGEVCIAGKNIAGMNREKGVNKELSNVSFSSK